MLGFFRRFPPKKTEKKMAILIQKAAVLCQKLIIALTFFKTPIFPPKMGKNR
jgi:hypothetical protein